eukprot:1140888-Pelagomonas_calceolata.AAC.1
MYPSLPSFLPHVPAATPPLFHDLIPTDHPLPQLRNQNHQDLVYLEDSSHKFGRQSLQSFPFASLDRQVKHLKQSRWSASKVPDNETKLLTNLQPLLRKDASFFQPSTEDASVQQQQQPDDIEAEADSRVNGSATTATKDNADILSDECACSEDGISGGVDVQLVGCAAHNGSTNQVYCYTTGGTACEEAVASAEYAGAAWRECGVQRDEEESFESDSGNDEISDAAVKEAVENTLP